MRYFITIYILLFCCRISAQEKLVNIDIGDEIPDVILQDIHDYEGQRIDLRKLSEKKLVIIDFWATWCGACLAAMPKLDSIAGTYPENVEVITVTREDKERVLGFLKKRRSRGDYVWKAAKIFGDSVLFHLFPYRTIPHYVWLKDGKVMAITEEVTSKAVQLALERGRTNLRTKVEREVEKLDRYKTSLLQFLQDGQETDLYLIKGYSLITGYVERLGATGGYSRVYLDSVSKVRFTGVNMTLSNLYRVAHGRARRYISDAAVEITSEDEYFTGNELSGMRFEDWLTNYGVSYEVIVNAENDLYEKMVSDLKEAFPQFKVHISETKDTCLVLEVFDYQPQNRWKIDNDLPARYFNNGDNMIVENGTISGLVTAFEAFVFRNDRYPLVDATDYKGKIKINLHGRLKTLAEINTALHPYGLKITKKISRFDKLFIEDKKK